MEISRFLHVFQIWVFLWFTQRKEKEIHIHIQYVIGLYTNILTIAFLYHSIKDVLLNMASPSLNSQYFSCLFIHRINIVTLMDNNKFCLEFAFVLQFRKYLKRKKSAEKINFQLGHPGLDDARRAEIQEQILRYRETNAVSITELLDYYHWSLFQTGTIDLNPRWLKPKALL